MVDINYKTKIVDGHEVYFGSWWICELEEEIHFNWYYRQAEMVYRNLIRKQKILEIGLGSGLLSDLLKRRKWNVSTLDIDEGKNPDFCENALDFEYAKYNIDAVLAFEIFEHIPYPTFTKLVEKMSREGVKKILFSIPWNERSLIRLSLKFPKVPKIDINFSIPRNKISTKAHFWELSRNAKEQDQGRRLVKFSEIINLFAAHGYHVERQKKVGYIQYFSATR